MKSSEVFAKTLLFGIVAAALVVAGVLVLGGKHADNDYLNGFMGWMLIAMGAATALFGAASIGGALWEERRQERAARLHVTPRAGAPAAPPAWGMGDIGRPGVRVDRMIGADTGGGGVRIVGLPIRHLDVPIVLGVLLVWTLVACLALAPR